MNYGVNLISFLVFGGNFKKVNINLRNILMVVINKYIKIFII